jgi:hypothetical protein
MFIVLVNLEQLTLSQMREVRPSHACTTFADKPKAKNKEESDHFTSSPSTRIPKRNCAPRLPSLLAKSDQIRPNPTKSDQIRPNPSIFFTRMNS